jgi:hypothetical protein
LGEGNPAVTWGSAPAGAVIYMTANAMVWSKNVLEFMFFTGIIGCVSVVIFSWVSILKSAFSDSNED